MARRKKKKEEKILQGNDILKIAHDNDPVSTTVIIVDKDKNQLNSFEDTTKYQIYKTKKSKKTRNLSPRKNLVQSFISVLRSENRRDFLTFTAALIAISLTGIGTLFFIDDVTGSQEAQSKIGENKEIDNSTKIYSSMETSNETTNEDPDSNEQQETLIDADEISTSITRIRLQEIEKNYSVVANSTISSTQKTSTSDTPKIKSSTTKTTLKKSTTTTTTKKITTTQKVEELRPQNFNINFKPGSPDFCAIKYSYTLSSMGSETVKEEIIPEENTCSNSWTVHLNSLKKGAVYTVYFIATNADGEQVSRTVSFTA